MIARVAGRQHGVVTREQLLALGLSSSSIGRRVSAGRLHPVLSGVYRVGHRAPNVLAGYAAAVLAGGPGAALSGRAGVHLLGLARGPAPVPEITTRHHRRVVGVIVHRARTLDERDVRRWHGIRVMTVPRLIVDLAATLSLDELVLVHHEARVRFKLQPEAVEAVLARRPRAPGGENVRAVIRGDPAVLLSRLERRFRRVLRDHGLPLPVTNRKEGAHYVDCRWPGHRLTVELDSYRFHHTRRAWEEDRERERAARARGDEFRRYTWRDVAEDPDWMLTDLRSLLQAR